MPGRAYASCPGRICLAGEDLDWLSGHSLLCAINLRLTTKVEDAVNSVRSEAITIRSDLYPGHTLVVPVAGPGVYTNDPLDYVQAAIKVLVKRTQVAIPSVLIDIRSEIPPSAGLASSAAVTLSSLCAIARFLGLHLSREELCQLAMEAETTELNTGAGAMDFYSCAFGGVMYIDCGRYPPHRINDLFLPSNIGIIVINTRVRRSTKRAISDKRARWASAETGMRNYVRAASSTVSGMLDLISQEPVDIVQLGKYVNDYQGYLADYLRVSTDLINACASTCLEYGAYGAKLTGTGMGGCLFALADQKYFDSITGALRQYPVDALIASVDRVGLT
jgi:mevalonate kinase